MIHFSVDFRGVLQNRALCRKAGGAVFVCAEVSTNRREDWHDAVLNAAKRK